MRKYQGGGGRRVEKTTERNGLRRWSRRERERERERENEDVT